MIAQTLRAMGILSPIVPHYRAVAMNYQPKLPRWKHQDDAIAAMNGAAAFALFMEMRTGKTKVILDEFGHDEDTGAIRQLLVVAPAGVYRTWEVDTKKHVSDELWERLRIGRWESKTAAKDKVAHKRFLDYKGPKILLVNIEALSTVKAARALCQQFLTAGPTTMVIDESTTIKSHTAMRTKFCLQVGFLAKKRRILSGLPTPQSPLDIHAQFAFLSPKILPESYPAFEQRYAILEGIPAGPGGRIINVIKGYQRLGELTDRLRPHSFRVRLDECYDMPEKIFMRRDIEMTAEQRKMYTDMKKYAVAELSNMERVTATVVLTQLLRLHQILAGHTKADDSGAIVDIPENKTAEVLDIVEKISGKAIIWAAYDADVKKITAALEKEYGPGSVARFWGGNRDTREDEEKLFKTNPACRFMVATAAAGGRGRTWDVADTIIYYSNTFSLEHRMQSEERTQGVGKKVGTAYFDLVCRDTVEEKILTALKSKKKLSDAVMEDGYRAWLT